MSLWGVFLLGFAGGTRRCPRDGPSAWSNALIPPETDPPATAAPLSCELRPTDQLGPPDAIGRRELNSCTRISTSICIVVVSRQDGQAGVSHGSVTVTALSVYRCIPRTGVEMAGLAR